MDETESSVGDFNVDIFASGKSADVIVWVVKHAREEHKAAIEWLNNHTDERIGFFLCEIKLYRIDTSEPAVKFEVIEKPNNWTKEVRKNGFISETDQRRYDYWVAFQDCAFQNAHFAKEFKRKNLQQNNVCLYIPDNMELYEELLSDDTKMKRGISNEQICILSLVDQTISDRYKGILLDRTVRQW